MHNCILDLLICRRNSCWQLLLRNARIVSSFRSRMVYRQKKDYFSFIEPAFHRVCVALNDFQFPNRLIGKAGTIAKPPKSPDMMSHKYLRLGISKTLSNLEKKRDFTREDCCSIRSVRCWKERVKSLTIV